MEGLNGGGKAGGLRPGNKVHVAGVLPGKKIGMGYSRVIRKKGGNSGLRYLVSREGAEGIVG